MIQMPDSVTPGNIPMGYAAVLGYADGRYRTSDRLPVLFPKAKHVLLTVSGATASADGVDCEPGNVNAAGAAGWARRRLAAEPSFRPVIYADLASRGYSMTEVLENLASSGVPRNRVRLLTAHYDGEHLCSPSRGCRDANGRVIAFTADGTQWTSIFPGVGGAAIDMSLLADDFFGAAPPSPANWTEKLVQQLPVVSQGASGAVVRTVQGLCCARGHSVTVDGVFGPATGQAVRNVQAAAKVAADGTVGPVTWPVLLGV